MKIRFHQLLIGQVFRFDGHLYMRIARTDQAVALDGDCAGACIEMDPDYVVEVRGDEIGLTADSWKGSDPCL